MSVEFTLFKASNRLAGFSFKLTPPQRREFERLSQESLRGLQPMIDALDLSMRASPKDALRINARNY